jgi:acyl-CoA dehydrogenase
VTGTADVDAASARYPDLSPVLATAGAFGDQVDRDARFPSEAVAAMREARLLGALVPAELGGPGRSLRSVAGDVAAVAAQCASSAMVLAMHHIEVACLVRHPRTPVLDDFCRRLVAEQLLIASATTELGVGGDIRRSMCAVEQDRGGFHLTKRAPVISYGAHADAVLATARRNAESPPSDQVMVLCTGPGLHLEPMGDWNTLGFRGTCSLGFTLEATGDPGWILPTPFGDIAGVTMLPVSHTLWSHVWLGIANAAVDRARAYIRGEARKQPGAVLPGALRLAELVGVHQSFAGRVGAALDMFEAFESDPGRMSSMATAIAMNTLKVTASTEVVDVVSRALVVCGIAGYREDSPYRMGRLLRDAHGAAVMVNNDRILQNTAQLLSVAKDG